MVPGISLLQILPENDFLPKSRKGHKPNLSLFLYLSVKLLYLPLKFLLRKRWQNKTAVAWIFLRVNWRAWIFFIYFSLAQIFCLYFARPRISFLMVRPLIKTGTVLIWYISSFLYSNVTLLDIRIETFHGSLIRQWEVNSIHQLFFSIVCQLLSKHILATFCDNDVARSNYFLNTNCNTLLFYFFS